MNLWQQYEAEKARQTGLYFPREGAADLGVSEAMLMLHAPQSVYLGGKERICDIVLQMETLGRVQSVVYNSLCVHEKQGIYENVNISPAGGLALNVGGLDLRFFTPRWHHAVAVTSNDRGRVARSVQFYDEFGAAIQKVFMKEDGKEAAWQLLLDTFAIDELPEFQTGERPPVAVPDALTAEREADFQQRWQQLQDVHHFGSLLANFDIDRQAGYRHAPAGAAKKLPQTVWQQVLEAVKAKDLEIMIFSGNRGIVQIQTGKVHNIVRSHGYLNVLDDKQEGFSMHLKDEGIVETWVVRRPIRDGFVTCVEGFDARRKTVLQIFGRRREGELEKAAWREITDGLLQMA